MKLQFTMFSTTGKYRPISTLITVSNWMEYHQNAKNLQIEAIKKMCAQRSVDWGWMKENGYTQMKVRKYDKEKLEAEAAERYEKIKKERGWA